MNPMNNVTLGWLLMEILFEKTWELGQELLILAVRKYVNFFINKKF